MTATACRDISELWDFDRPEVSEKRFRECLAGTLDVTLRAELLTQAARAQGLQRRFEEARATLAEAEALLGEAEPRAQVRWLLESGRVLNSRCRPAEAVPLFDEARKLAVEAREDYLAVDAAHMLGIAAEPEARIGWHEWALEWAARSEDPRTRGWFGSLANNLGWTLHDLGRYDEALVMFERALAWRQGRGDVAGTRIAVWTVARCLRSLGRVEEALARQRELRAELDAVGEDDPYVAEELGECLLVLGREDEATPHFGRAWEALSQDAWLGEREPERLARLQRLGRRG